MKPPESKLSSLLLSLKHWQRVRSPCARQSRLRKPSSSLRNWQKKLQLSLLLNKWKLNSRKNSTL